MQQQQGHDPSPASHLGTGTRLESRFLQWWAGVKAFQQQNCQQSASEPLILSLVVAVTVILYYLLPACVRRAELWFSSQAGGPEHPVFCMSACPPSTKTFYCRVITNINETLPVTISTIPHPLSPGLTPFALQIKERVYEPALAWQCWWGVITVERLSCSLHTLPLSSLGQKKKKWRHREEVKQQCYGVATTAALRCCFECMRGGFSGRLQLVSVPQMWSCEKLIFCSYHCILAASSLLQLLALHYDRAHTIIVKAVS